MADYKSLDYLKEIKDSNIMSNDELIDMLQNVSYILADNGYQDARYFIDAIIDDIEDGEIEI